VLTFSTSTSSSSLLDFGQSVMSSTKTSSFSWDCRGPIFSSGFAKVFGLGLETPFSAPEFCPISPCYTVEVSSSTHFRLMDYGSEGGNILQLDHIFKLLHSLLTPLALQSNQDELPWHAKIWWSHPVSNSHTFFLLRKLLAKAHPLFFSLGSNNR
jgi:hypothetical protein